jgi:hypothetical protein
MASAKTVRLSCKPKFEVFFCLGDRKRHSVANTGSVNTTLFGIVDQYRLAFVIAGVLFIDLGKILGG